MNEQPEQSLRLVYTRRPSNKEMHRLAGHRMLGIIDYQAHDNGLAKLPDGTVLSESGFRRLYPDGLLIIVLRGAHQQRRLDYQARKAQEGIETNVNQN